MLRLSCDKLLGKHAEGEKTVATGMVVSHADALAAGVVMSRRGALAPHPISFFKWDGLVALKQVSWETTLCKQDEFSRVFSLWDRFYRGQSGAHHPCKFGRVMKMGVHHPGKENIIQRFSWVFATQERKTSTLKERNHSEGGGRFLVVGEIWLLGHDSHPKMHASPQALCTFFNHLRVGHKLSRQRPGTVSWV